MILVSKVYNVSKINCLKYSLLLALIFPRNDFVVNCHHNNTEAIRGVEVSLLKLLPLKETLLDNVISFVVF